MPPYRLMYRLGVAPWERRDVAESWRPLFEGPTAMAPGRALDVGCGSGADAVHLAARGWRVTGVEVVETALARARRRAAEAGVEVRWVGGDVARLGRLGLEPGYDLLYDFGCIQGLPDPARRGAAAGLGHLAAAGGERAAAAAAARHGRGGRRRAAGRGLGAGARRVGRHRRDAAAGAPGRADALPPGPAKRGVARRAGHQRGACRLSGWRGNPSSGIGSHGAAYATN